MLDQGRHHGRIKMLCLLVPAFFAGMAGPFGASAATGSEKLFDPCATCHDLGKGARHGVGPHLDRLFGRVAGSLEDFRYSESMRAAGAAGLVWTAETLDKYLEKPRDFIKGNRMVYRGMEDADDRQALISWLETASEQEPASASAAGEVSTSSQVRDLADAVLQMKGDPEYGEYLAGDCVTCHQASGKTAGIPPIVGLPKDYFVTALFEYSTGVRPNDVMKLRVANLSHEEIAALAAYFSSLDPQ
ncbi:cytochrome c [Hoeflea halophila]|uniref:Cytochrome c n=1 Tax=Hoeflea halophila TaxID=714899 RepID=A0A286HLT7_9HYPH|nr:c-type cytochrome [Hoeflea halophila]SOE08738.1 cytochrome c [Hoeflea halophila]